MKVGTLKGRHPLPVETYLIEGEVDASPQPTVVKALFERLHQAVEKLNLSREARVELYLTGLTRASLLAVDLLRATGATVIVVEYDSTTGDYVPTLFCAEQSRLLPTL